MMSPALAGDNGQSHGWPLANQWEQSLATIVKQLVGLLANHRLNTRTEKI